MSQPMPILMRPPGWPLRRPPGRATAPPMSRSRVILPLSGSPSTHATGPSNSANTSPSSTQEAPAAAAFSWAARMRGYEKPCGVCARRMVCRGRWRRTSGCPPTSFTASAASSTGTQAPRSAAAARTRRTRAALAQGRAPSWISTRAGVSAASASRPSSTDCWRVAPPSTRRRAAGGACGASSADASATCPGGTVTTTGKNPSGEEGATARASTGTPSRSRNSFLAPSLIRGLAPAAVTTTAAGRGGVTSHFVLSRRRRAPRRPPCRARGRRRPRRRAGAGRCRRACARGWAAPSSGSGGTGRARRWRCR